MWRPSSDASGHRSIAWRDTLLPLKQGVKANGILPAAQVLSALEALVAQPNSTAVKEYEVSEDLCFLAQQLRTLQSQGHSGGRGEVLFCRLVASALHGRRVVMQPAAANIVCGTLRCWADNSDDADASGDRQLQVEALHALAALLQDNVAQIASHEQTAVLALLQALAHGTASPLTSPASGARRARPTEPVEVRRQALQALAACCPAKPGAPGLAPERLTEALQVTVQALTSATVDRRTPEDAATSKFLATLVKALTGMVQVAGRAWVPHTAAIVDGLCCLMTYGLLGGTDARPAVAAASAAAAAATASLPTSVKPATATKPLATTPMAAAAVAAPAAAAAALGGGTAAGAGGVGGAQPASALAPGASPGCSVAAGASSGAQAAAAAPIKGRYLPPHLRGAAAAAAPSPPPGAAAATLAAGGLPGASAPGPAGQPATSPVPVLGFGQRSTGRPAASPRSSVGPSLRGDPGSDGEDAADGARLDVDRLKSSRIRLGLLQCLQAMAKSDSRALHQHWTALLPTALQLQHRAATPNLGTMLLFDPVAKVRSMAAATIACLLEGPQQRSYLAMAEARSMLSMQTTPTPLPPPPQQQQGGRAPGAGRAPALNPALAQRGFTTLSATLGQTVLALHQCLLQAARGDANPAVVQVALRSLCCLMAGAPYERLPAPLLPDVLDGLWSCWLQRQAAASTSGGASPAGRWRAAAPAPLVLPQDLASGALPTSELVAVQAACLACLAEGLLTRTPVPGLAAHLRRQVEAGQATLAGSTAAAAPEASPSPGPEQGRTETRSQATGAAALPLVSELLACCFNRNAVIRVEALAALRGLASNYPFALNPAARVADAALGPGADTGVAARVDAEVASGGSCWDATLAAVRTSLDCSALAAAAPARPAYSPRRTSHSGGAGGLTPRGAAAAAPAAAALEPPATASASTSPEDKAAQHAVQLLAASLRVQALQLGLRVDPESELGEVPEPGGPPSSLASGPGAPAASPRRPAPSSGAAPQLDESVGGGGGGGGEDAASAAAAGQAALAERWQQAQQLLVPLACASHSYMVRSAALAALAALPEAVGARLPAAMRQGLLELLAGAAEADSAAAVRSMACKALGVLLTHGWVLDAACRDRSSSGSSGSSEATGAGHPPSASAAAAAAAVGALAAGGADAGRDGWQRALVLRCLDSLAKGLGDGTLSVRISAAWALSSLCDAVKRGLLAASQRQLLSSGSQTGSAGAAPGTTTGSAAGDKVQLADQREVQSSTQAEGDMWGGGVLPSWLYEPLESCVLLAVQDTDKVRCNGVRALGSLLALDCAVGHRLDPEGGAAGGGGNDGSGGQGGGCGSGGGQGEGGGVVRGVLLERALQGLQSCLTTGNMKVQWNACYAAQELLLHVAGLGGDEDDAPGGVGSREASWSGDLARVGSGSLGTGAGAAAGAALPPARQLLVARLAPLLLLLVMLVRDSSNFKIRLHAAAALSAPRRRWVYGDCYPDAVLVTCAALEGHDDSSTAAPLGGTGGEPGPHPGTTVPSSGEGQGSGLATGRTSNGRGAGGPRGKGQGGAGAGGGEASDAAFPNYRYAAGLRQQLGATLLHLLCLAEDADGARVREALLKRAEALQAVLLSAAEAAVAATSLWGAVAAERDAQLEASAARSQLPLDPFELRPDTSPTAAAAALGAAAGAQQGMPPPLPASSQLQAPQQGGLPFAKQLGEALRLASGLPRQEAPGDATGAGAAATAQVRAVLAALRGMDRLLQGSPRQAPQRNGQGWALLGEVLQLAASLEQWTSLSAALGC